MAGAAYGRFFGELLNLYAPGYSTTPPGNFALIGAAAMLGGISRMTISITVIVLECTTNIIYVLPIALAIMIAKIVGDLFNLVRSAGNGGGVGFAPPPFPPRPSPAALCHAPPGAPFPSRSHPITHKQLRPSLPAPRT